MLSEQVHQQHDQQAPPGLRMAHGNEGCANCRFYKPRSVSAGSCGRYGDYPVRPGQTCNSWAAQQPQSQPPGPVSAQVGQPQQGV